jgi:hypothetical protein
MAFSLAPCTFQTGPFAEEGLDAVPKPLAQFQRSLPEDEVVVADVEVEGFLLLLVVLAGPDHGPGQAAIALPYFGPGGPGGDRCRFIDPDTLRPIPLEYLYDHWDRADHGAPRRLPAMPKRGPFRETEPWLRSRVEALVDSWPPIGEGEVHTTPSGKVKGGRSDAAFAHVGELAHHGFYGEAALSMMRRWNTKNPKPLMDRTIESMVERATLAYKDLERSAKLKLVEDGCFPAGASCDTVKAKEKAEGL